ncbi:MAG TPA: response regulator [Vicinamibacterales bacterium]|nr:response regulator [Vicinamibacterales bacterium]
MSQTAPPIAIAIVDDDASVRAALRRLCNAVGYRATAYASGREFLAALEADPTCADCLILDTHMPEMSGIELQRHLVTSGVRIPTIVVTADEASDAPMHYVALGIAAYLVKPVSSDDLLAAIARSLGATPESLVGPAHP